MKRILLLLALVPTLSLADSVEAACASKQKIFEQMFKKYQETHLEFESLNEMRANKTTIALYSNPSTGSWTLVEYDKERACVLGSGKRDFI